MRSLALVVTAAFLSPLCLAQTKTTAPIAPPRATTTSVPCRTLVKCQAQLKEANEVASQLADMSASRTIERDILAAANKNLEASNAQLTESLNGAMTVMKILDKEMKFTILTDDDKKALSAVQAGDIMNLGVAIENSQNEYLKVVQKLVSDNDSTVQKYNALLSDYKDYVTRVGIQLIAIGQANRISNALALYNALPKYTPPQTVNIRLMNCTALPALCVQ